MALSEKNATLAKYLAAMAALGLFLHFDAQVQTNAVEKDLVRSCERTNDLRAEVSERVVSTRATRAVLKGFLREAVSARHQSGDHAVAERYQALLDRAREIKSEPVAQVDCEEVIERQGIG